MNRGALLKASRESWPWTALAAGGLALVEAVMAFAFLSFRDQIAAVWSQLSLFRTFLQAAFGAELGGQVGPQALGSIPWVHPVVLAILWGHAIAAGTRLPVGELDRGTIDILLGLPVSRWRLWVTESLVGLASTAVVVLGAAAGNVVGNLAGAGRLEFGMGRMALVLANLLALALAVEGIASLASALGDRRARVLAWVIALVLAAALVHYLAPFWDPAKRLSVLAPLRYYRPLAVLEGGGAPLGDVAVLLGAAAVFWAAGGMVFARRDLAAG